MTPSPHEALRAWFLGPRAENADLFERLVTEALRDHVFWRRNHHPEDGFTIRETDRRTPGYEEAVATLTQEMLGLLSELKRGVPFFSGRYKGHMASEQTIASQIGYFAAMLYNPNNVAIEASPVTTRLELEVGTQLAGMVGYDQVRSWGHLTSGGTVANFEAMWVARNVIYLPVAARGAADALGVELEVRTASGDRAPLKRLGLAELLNIPHEAVLDLREELWRAAEPGEVKSALEEHSLQALGYQEYARRLASAFGDALPPGVVLVAATAHYSWEKILRALGIGSRQLVFVPVDGHYRMDPDALWETVKDLHRRGIPVLACISVCGTTEESAVDRLDRVLEVRARAERELGVTFHLHSDACYGGYAASVLWDAEGEPRTPAAIRESTGVDWPSDDWVDSMRALAGAESVTIDPHKLGYIPYPAGAILFRDRRARELVAIDPPYLLPSTTAGGASGNDGAAAEDLFLGRFILEGSKPGAAAAAVWLSHKVLPLDERGYGHLVEQTVVGARRLHETLSEHRWEPFRILLLPRPDINIVCWLMTHPELTSLEAVNALNEGIYDRMSLSVPGAQPAYIITRTRFQTPMYDGAVDPLLEALEVAGPEEWKAAGTEGLVVLRSTVMDPFLAVTPEGKGHLQGFVQALGRAAKASLEGLGGDY